MRSPFHHLTLLRLAKAGAFEEQDHPRADDGKFAEKGGGEAAHGNKDGGSLRTPGAVLVDNAAHTGDDFRINAPDGSFVQAYYRNADFPGDSGKRSRGEIFFVESKTQRQGIGTKLVIDALATMRADGAETVNMTAQSSDGGRALVAGLVRRGVISEAIRTADSGKSEHRILASDGDKESVDAQPKPTEYEDQYINSVIERGGDGHKADLVMEAMFSGELPKAEPGMKYTYFSFNRPIMISAADLGVGKVQAGSFDGGRKSVFYTDQPVPLKALASYELSPQHGGSLAQMILGYTKATGKTLEFYKELDNHKVHAAAVFKNPRGKWQASYFDERGPFTHSEHDTPQKAIQDVTGSMKFVKLMPGIVDMMAPNFDEDLLAHMQRGFSVSKAIKETSYV